LRLTSVKLAGFKSFVDPTSIAVPGQLVGVVGPNGCGKSNVIDAVRWVLGESSARQLRGENMHDVIFNGSTERKPVSRASVELVVAAVAACLLAGEMLRAQDWAGGTLIVAASLASAWMERRARLGGLSR